MRVLQVITDTDRRGAQVFATDLGTAMQGLGHHVETVALVVGEQRPRLDVETLGHRQRGPRTLRRLRRRMGTADVTIAHGSATGLACALAGFPNLPFVYRQISDTRFWAGTRFRRWRVARYLARARAIVALSAGAQQDLVDHLGLSPDQIRVVPNGVPVGSFHVAGPDERRTGRERLGLPLDDIVVLDIGALVPEKGADVAIRAVEGLDGVTLAVVGGGPERAALERLAADSDVDRTRFLGVLADASPAYAAADVVVLPSKGGDSMPATLIEAGFCGLPAVATPIGSIEDVVVQERTGLIVPPGDVAALRAAIERLAADPDERRRFGDDARRHCLAEFEIGVVAERWLAVLEEVVTRKHDGERGHELPATIVAGDGGGSVGHE